MMTWAGDKILVLWGGDIEDPLGYDNPIYSLERQALLLPSLCVCVCVCVCESPCQRWKWRRRETKQLAQDHTALKGQILHSASSALLTTQSVPEALGRRTIQGLCCRQKAGGTLTTFWFAFHCLETRVLPQSETLQPR